MGTVKVIQRLMMPGADGEVMLPLAAPYGAFNRVFDRVYMGREELSDKAFFETLDVFLNAPKTSQVGRSVYGGVHCEALVYPPALGKEEIEDVERFAAWPKWHVGPLQVERIFFLTLEKHLDDAHAWLRDECRGNTRGLVKEPTYFSESAYLRALCNNMEGPLTMLSEYTRVVGWLMLKPFPLFYTVSKTMYAGFSRACIA